jgi:hypothetical protein
VHPQPALPDANAERIVRQLHRGRAVVFPESDFTGPAHGLLGVFSAGVGSALRRRRPDTVGEREPVSLRDRR